MWSGTGWLSPFNVTEDGPAITGGVIDFAGSGVVHMVGGWSGLMGAIFLGPRLGRFDENSSPALKQQFMMGHHVPYQVLGTFILWFGWFGFNPGSTLIASGAMELAGKVAVNTTISAAVGGITVAFINRFIPGGCGFWSVPSVCNGTLAGLVSITAPCSVVAPWSAICIGFVGGFFYYGSTSLMELLKIDDPLDAFSVHGACGMWGIFSVAVFAYDSEAIVFGGYDETVANLDRESRFFAQSIAIVSIAGWTIINSGLLFALLKVLKILRVDVELERKGLDIDEHGGIGQTYAPAYSIIGRTFSGKGSSLVDRCIVDEVYNAVDDGEDENSMTVEKVPMIVEEEDSSINDI